MASQFPGFTPKALTFFRQLEKNNDREWFAKHKEFFDQQVHAPMVELVTLMCDEFRHFAVSYLPDKPPKAIYRIYRDTRFSNDKTPYKTHIAAQFQHRRLSKNRGAGFYFEITHDHVGIASGMYMPDAEQLLAVRQALAQRGEEFRRLCQAKPLSKLYGDLQGEALARVPKGFDPQSSAADLLRQKQWYFYIELDAKTACTPKLYTEIMRRFRESLPVVEFLNAAVIRALQQEPEDDIPVRPAPMF